MPTPEKTMNNFILNDHIFKLDEIIKEYESCLIKNNTVLEYNHCETQESIEAQFRAYDTYILFDRSLSCLVIESLVSPSFREFIKIYFSHYDDFDNFPGKVYFMMILDVCNTSDAIIIEGAEKPFTNISLNGFHGENISDLATTALRNIKGMRSAYALHQKIGTTILMKVYKTSSDILN